VLLALTGAPWVISAKDFTRIGNILQTFPDYYVITEPFVNQRQKHFMDRFDRIYSLHALFVNARYPVSRKLLEEKMECSRATIERTIEDMRDYLGAPLKYDRSANGYFYDTDEDAPYQLPGLWLNGGELNALLVIQELLASLQPGLLDEQLQPLKKRIKAILALKPLGGGEIGKRVRILQMAARTVNNDIFQRVAAALVQRERVAIQYHGRERNLETQRIISPQRLVHYRDNWYLDAWCHEREALRSFSLDRIATAQHQSEDVREVDAQILDAHFTQAYGIFSGDAMQTALLHFSAKRARWVADEQWHPQQQTQFLEDGRYELRIPYSDPRELLMDILKYGVDVEVVAPQALRQAVKAALEAAAQQYQ